MVDDLRERIRRGDPAAFADPAMPLLLLSGALEAPEVCRGVVAYLLNGGAPPPWLSDLAQSWWQDHANGETLLNVLLLLGARAGRGSAAHRRAVLVMCLFARAAQPQAWRWQAQAEGCLADLERWAWGEQGIEIEATRRRAGELHRAVSATGVDVFPADAGDDLLGIVGVDMAAEFAVNPVMSVDQDDLLDTHLADTATEALLKRALADLIRAAVPLCPLIEAP